MRPPSAPSPLARLLSLLLVLNLFLMRPAALGQRLSWIAIAASPVLSVALLLHERRSRHLSTHDLRSDIEWLGALLAIYWLYIGPISIVFGRSDLLLAAKEFVTTAIIVLPYALFLIDIRRNALFFRQFTLVVSLLGWSSLVTAVLSIALGSKDPLLLFSLNIKGYTDNALDPSSATGAVYFPLSMLYTDFTADSIVLSRYSGFFREAGIYQAMACFGLVYEACTRRSRAVMLGLLAGTILAFSSLGIALLALTIGALFLLSPSSSRVARAGLAFLFVGAAYPIALFTPVIGLQEKLLTHGTSISDRSVAIAHGLRAVAGNPFGYGLFSTNEANSAICLVASLGMLGLIGFTIQCLILSGWRPGSRAGLAKVVACAPILVTALISQPIAGAPMTYVIAMVSVPSAIASRRYAVRQRRTVRHDRPGSRDMPEPV